MTVAPVWALYRSGSSGWWGIGRFEVTAPNVRLRACDFQDGCACRTKAEAMLRFQIARPAERVYDFSGLRMFSPAEDILKALEKEVDG